MRPPSSSAMTFRFCIRPSSAAAARRSMPQTVTAKRHLSLSLPDPFVIVGGGPSGLFLSILLSQYDVPNIVVERQLPESRFRHPQAHFLNTRTMELLKYSLPASTYDKIRQAMPPVEHWNHFRFAHSMSDERPLAQVLHPVDRPLQAGVDANGILVEDDCQDCSPRVKNSQSIAAKYLSPCSVGHLAQHTFCKILHELACQQEQSDIRYGTAVTSAIRDSATRQMTVSCDDGSSYTTCLVIAADGAQSSLRTAHRIPWRGQHAMQHLMNIHVTLDAQQARQLHRDNNHAMLYSIFNEHVVAMVVCHSLGDYIVQIPFFAPYQTAEDDFSPKKVDTILKSIFGHRVRSWNVQSAKPWIMSSMIAQQYYADGVALVGDAAHVFPPAGGFGMNTGLQDAHNLAWKLAEYHHSDDERDLKGVLQSYQQERQPIAQQNAALSVRNYQRLLQVTESCYLNEKHPNLLATILERSPLPLAGKQALFRSLFQAALLPLSWIGSAPDSMYATHVRNNLRKVLGGGAGLPLLFPRHELGFQYGIADSVSVQHWRHDTMSVAPELKVGKLVPHAEVRILSDATQYFNLRHIRPGFISTSNLPAQLKRTARPSFVLLVAGNHDDSLVESLRQRLADNGLVIDVVWLNSDTKNLDGLVVQEQIDHDSAFSFQTESPCIILIRPDSHICYISETMSPQDMESFIDGALSSFRSLSITH